MLLISQVREIVKTAPITENKEQRITAFFPNPSFGSPLQLTGAPGEDFKVILHKTPRYYPREPLTLSRVQKDVASYVTGKTAVLDFTYNDGTEGRIDRVVKASEAEDLSLSSLIDLSIRIRLLSSHELKDLLAAGGTVNVHFWDAAKNYRYRQIGDALQKI